MLNFLVFSFVCYGISITFVHSKGPWGIFSSLREFVGTISTTLGDLLSCMLCFPFWVGFVLSLINSILLPDFFITPFYIIITPNEAYGVWLYIITAILDGFISQGVVWLIHNMEEYFEQ